MRNSLNQAKPKKNLRHKDRLLWVTLLLLTTLLASAIGVYAQTTTPLLTITGVDTSQFPNVTVTVYGEGVDGGLADTQLTLLEDGREIEPRSDEFQTVGVQVLFAYDAWSRVSDRVESESAVIARQDRVHQAISQLTSQQLLADGVAWLQVMSFDNSGQRAVPQVLKPWSTDNQGAIDSLSTQVYKGYENAKTSTPLGDLILAAIQAFDDAGPPANLPRFVIIFTDGYDQLAIATKDDLIRQAQQRGVRIHTVQIEGFSFPERRRNLENLAQQTNGRFERLEGDNLLLPNLWESIEAAQQQRVLAYRSTNPQARQVSVLANAGSTVLRHTYDPLIGPVPLPQVTIVRPTETRIERGLADGTTAPFELPPDQLEPKTIRIEVQVGWPDDSQRELRSVEYSIGDKTVTQTGENATSIDFPIETFDSGHYTIRVRATDELGLTGEAAIHSLEIYVPRLPVKQAPVVRILQPEGAELERVAPGGQPLRYGTPLSELEPNALEISVELDWPDQQPRAVERVEYRIADQTVVRTEEPFTTVAFPIGALDNGDYTISVRAIDDEGRIGNPVTKPLKVTINWPPTPQPGTITFGAPTTNVITRTQTNGSRPAADTPLAVLVPQTVTITFDIVWEDNQPHELQRVEYVIGDKTMVRTEAPFTPVVFPIEGFDRGDYTIRVRAVDGYGVTTEQIQPLSIQIDWLAPPSPWLMYVALALAGLSLVFAAVMWYNPRFRRRVTQVAVTTAGRATTFATQIFKGGSASEGVALARLNRVAGGNSIPLIIDLYSGINKLGRSSSSSTAQINDPNISREHCRIEEQNGVFWVFDLGSQNKTKVNGQQVGAGGVSLQNGDIIGMGPVKYQFEPLSTPFIPPDDEDGATQMYSSSSGDPRKTRPHEEMDWGPPDPDPVWGDAGPTQPDTQTDLDGNSQQPGRNTAPNSYIDDHIIEDETDQTQVSPKTRPRKKQE